MSATLPAAKYRSNNAATILTASYAYSSGGGLTSVTLTLGTPGAGYACLGMSFTSYMYVPGGGSNIFSNQATLYIGGTAAHAAGGYGWTGGTTPPVMATGNGSFLPIAVGSTDSITVTVNQVTSSGTACYFFQAWAQAILVPIASLA